MKRKIWVFSPMLALAVAACGGGPGSSGPAGAGGAGSGGSGGAGGGPAKLVTVKITGEAAGLSNLGQAQVSAQEDDKITSLGSFAEYSVKPYQTDCRYKKSLVMRLSLPGYRSEQIPATVKPESCLEAGDSYQVTVAVARELSGCPYCKGCAKNPDCYVWTCELDYFKKSGAPDGSKTLSGRVEMSLVEADAKGKPYFDVAFDFAARFNLLGDTIAGEYNAYVKKGQVAADGRSLDYVSTYATDGWYSEAHCTRP